MSKETKPDPVVILQDFLKREKIELSITTEAVGVGDGSMIVRPKLNVRRVQ